MRSLVKKGIEQKFRSRQSTLRTAGGQDVIVPIENSPVKLQLVEHMQDTLQKGRKTQKIIVVENINSKMASNFEPSAHNASLYQKFKNELAINEIKNTINTTQHGLKRLLERGMSTSYINLVKNSPDIIKIQRDGAKVFIKKFNKKYSFIVEGKNGIITGLKNISEKSLKKLTTNYNWK